MDDDDMLREILLRLPPWPSSLPRASSVCKRWRLLVSDPRFLRRFRRHHRRNPPLFGFFVHLLEGVTFVPTMGAPNRVPPGHFSLQLDRAGDFLPMGCRHGLVLIYGQTQRQFIVWDPITGDQNRVALPPGFDPKTTEVEGAVLRAAGGVHFQVVSLAMGSDGTQYGQRAIAYVYSYETGVWGDLISSPIPSVFPNAQALCTAPAVLVGDSLYWILDGSLPSILDPRKILEFDLKRQSLVVIPVLTDSLEDIRTVMQAEGGGLGFLSLSQFTARLWKRNTNSDGADSWVLGRTIELDKLLSLTLNKENRTVRPFIEGFAENNNVLFLRTDIGVFMVHLQSLKFQRLFKTRTVHYCHPFEWVYTAETGSSGGHDGGGLLHNT